MTFDDAQIELSRRLEKIGDHVTEFQRIAADEDMADDLAKIISHSADEIEEHLGFVDERLDDMHSAFHGGEGVETGRVDVLHEAICEGRQQDAIDILNDMFPEANLRSLKTQANLFPDRVVGA